MWDAVLTRILIALQPYITKEMVSRMSDIHSCLKNLENNSTINPKETEESKNDIKTGTQ